MMHWPYWIVSVYWLFLIGKIEAIFAEKRNKKIDEYWDKKRDEQRQKFINYVTGRDYD